MAHTGKHPCTYSPAQRRAAGTNPWVVFLNGKKPQAPARGAEASISALLLKRKKKTKPKK